MVFNGKGLGLSASTRVYWCTTCLYSINFDLETEKSYGPLSEWLQVLNDIFDEHEDSDHSTMVEGFNMLEDLPNVPPGMFVYYCNTCGESISFDKETADSYDDTWYAVMTDAMDEHFRGNNGCI